MRRCRRVLPPDRSGDNRYRSLPVMGVQHTLYPHPAHAAEQRAPMDDAGRGH